MKNHIAIRVVFTDSKTGGFTYHEKTPIITASQVNPSEDVYNKTTRMLKDAKIEQIDCSELVVSLIINV